MDATTPRRSLPIWRRLFSADDAGPADKSVVTYETLTRLALPFGALALLGMIAFSAIVAMRTESALSQAEQVQDLRTVVSDLVTAVQAAETGQRGFLLTGRALYLKPYDQAVATVPEALVNLDRHASLLQGERERYDRFRALVVAKMAELGQTVRLARAGRVDDAKAILQTDRGQIAMQGISELAGQMATRERLMLTGDLARSRSGARQVVAVNVLAVAVLLAVGSALLMVAGRDLRRLARARSSLQLANEALEAGHARLDAAVRERTAELTLANEEVQRFAYIVSHDLRAPLLNIIGFTSELEVALTDIGNFVTERIAAGEPVPAGVREATERDLPEAIRFIQTSSAKMDRLISAILRLSREGRRVLVPEAIDMNALLSITADSVRHQVDAQGATLVVGDMPRLVGDRLATEQVFGNLVENAVKYLAPGRPGRIELRGWRDGADVVFEVADNGRGIAPRDHERIFDLFRRAGVQNTRGEGIGLAHVRALVRRMGGRIDCQSAADVGSTFTVRLPAVLTHLPGR